MVGPRSTATQLQRHGRRAVERDGEGWGVVERGGEGWRTVTFISLRIGYIHQLPPSKTVTSVAEDGLARQFMLQVDGLGKIDLISEVKWWYLDEQRVKRGESEALRTSVAIDGDEWVDDKQFMAWVQGTRRNAEGFRRRVMSLRGGRLAAVLTRERDAGSIVDGLAQAVASVLQALRPSCQCAQGRCSQARPSAGTAAVAPSCPCLAFLPISGPAVRPSVFPCPSL
ncbi:unnamed protein product [Closterium sp. NIES-65]|nr:unnamed protein product [Closterium sp. NIES-65]